ncbi:MAG: metal ABC transporter permease [Clostridia bacterium]|nr:metal ABC transporter permease [Clostridia bacterium]
MPTLLQYLQYSFVIYALVVGILISASSSCLGVSLVLRKYSLIGDGLSHVAFGAMCVAAAASVTNDMLIIMPVTILAAIVLMCFGSKLGLKGDAAIALLSVSALAIGYMISNTASVSSTDVCSTLFGTQAIITLTESDVWLCIIMSLVVAVFFIVFYNKIFAVTFDEDFLQASGGKAKVYNFLMAVITAIVIALSMKLVGSLLITALIIFPAMSAMRLFKSYRSVIIFSVCFSVVATTVGIIIAIMASKLPVGSTIVMTDLVMFIVCAIAGGIKKRVKVKKESV